MSSELRVDKIVPTSGVPTGGGGGIVQVKYAIKNNTQSIAAQSGYSWNVDISGLSLSITPKFSTSKFLVQMHIGCHGTTGNAACTFRIYRDSTDITLTDANTDNRMGGTVFYNSNNTAMGIPASMNVLDSPATTSAITYKVTGFTNSGTLWINRLPGDSTWNTISTLTVMEVSG